MEAHLAGMTAKEITAMQERLESAEHLLKEFSDHPTVVEYMPKTRERVQHWLSNRHYWTFVGDRNVCQHCGELYDFSKSNYGCLIIST